MNKKELKKELLEILLKRLSELGFDKKIRGQSFWKPINNGRGSVHLSFINHSNDFDVTLDFAVRIEALEDLKNRNNQHLKPKEKKETATVGVELGNLKDGVQKRWTVATQVDIGKVSEEIYKNIVEVGIPYIEKYSNLENILLLSLRDDEAGWLHSPFHHDRAMNAVGLAKLLKREDIKEIVDMKKKYLKERNDHGLTEFQLFVTSILR